MVIISIIRLKVLIDRVQEGLAAVFTGECYGPSK